jgi:hypothetical protein
MFQQLLFRVSYAVILMQDRGRVPAVIYYPSSRIQADLFRFHGTHGHDGTATIFGRNPIPSRWLFPRAKGFFKRMGAYNWRLFVRNKPPNLGHAMLQWLARLIGPGISRLVSNGSQY